MMYTALSLRPHITIPPSPASFVFLAVTYFNVVLPAYLPRTTDLKSTFWHCARWVKLQKRRYIGSPMLVSRILEMNKARCRRAKAFAEEDDEALRSRRSTPVHSATTKAVNKEPLTIALQPPLPPKQPISFPSSIQPPQISLPPSEALLGLSMLGNLDELYGSHVYPLLQLTRAFAGTRKCKGGILMVTHTFRGRLNVNLAWDIERGLWSCF